MSTRLRAAPQFDRQGQRFGTFEVWRRGVREVPIPLQYRETHGAIGAGTSGVRTFAIGEDLAPIAPLSRGYTLQDALRSLPQLRQLLTQFGMHTGCARATISAEVDSATKAGLVRFVIHPCDPTTLDELYGRMLFEAEAVNSLSIRELPSRLILQYPLHEGGTWAFRSRLPPGVAVNVEQHFFVTNGWKLGEFGSLYVAPHIAGNLCRYYPDEWMGGLKYELQHRNPISASEPLMYAWSIVDAIDRIRALHHTPVFALRPSPDGPSPRTVMFSDVNRLRVVNDHPSGKLQQVVAEGDPARGLTV